METLLTDMKISYLSLDSTPLTQMSSAVARKPKVVIGSIESFINKEIRGLIRHLNVKYISVDECQVYLFTNFKMPATYLKR